MWARGGGSSLAHCCKNVFSQLPMKQIPFALATAEAHALTPTLPSLSPVPRTLLHQPPIVPWDLREKMKQQELRGSGGDRQG